MQNRARALLREYCKPVNWLTMMQDLATERGIPQSDLQALIDSGEYGIGERDGIWMIRKSKLYTPPISKNKDFIDINELLNSIDPANVYAGELATNIKETAWQSVQCPFHDDTNPSMGVHLPSGGYNCLSCGASGGNPVDFIQNLHDLSFKNALKYLKEHY